MEIIETREVHEDINMCLWNRFRSGAEAEVGLQVDGVERSREASCSGLGRPVPFGCSCL